jgi:hypothetical protein
VRSGCLDAFDLDIVAVEETHLCDQDKLLFEDFEWYGNNRTHLHRRARRGSGGVGFMVRKSLLDTFRCIVLDDTEEGILWLKLTSLSDDFTLCCCACYLPPEGTTRYVDPHAFYDTLLAQVLVYQEECDLFYLCGDFNGRCGNLPDFIEGVDSVCERQVLDTTVNKYGELLCDFLLSSDCCMLNGRNTDGNYYTFRDVSVIDYCLIPHHALDLFMDFVVHRVDDMFQEMGMLGTVANPAQTLPDHNLLTWSIDVSAYLSHTLQMGRQAAAIPSTQSVRFDCSAIPDGFLGSDDTLRMIENCIQRIELGLCDQADINDCYDSFCEVIKSEMGTYLPSRTIRFSDGLSNKRRRIKKPYWNDSLSALWKEHTSAQKAVGKARGPEKQRLKVIAKQKRKALDRAIQCEKRKYWHKMQTDLLELQSSDPKEYWKFVGKLGMSSTRKVHIPWEALASDGTVASQYDEVMSIWKEHFNTLLNSDADSECEPRPVSVTVTQHEVMRDGMLDADISLEEVRSALARAKNGKATGWDDIPVEVLRNESAITYLHILFNKCFQLGVIPEMWSKSVINPIPKNSTAEIREPANYRGITLASSVYKLYAGILNGRLGKWAEVYRRISDEQNGFRKQRGCVDHLSTLSQIIDTRKKRGLNTFVAFIDFSKAYDRISRPLLWHKLQQHGISPKLLSALKSLYQEVKCCVRVNGHNTDWFKVSVGLKQGCLISPLLFNLYINDLVAEINSLNCGIPVDDEFISLLLYADDIALLAPCEDYLQRMLDRLHEWCLQWRLVVNIEKSQVVHFRRGPSMPRSDFLFKCGENQLKTVEKYRYLGLVFTEFLDLTVMSKAVALAATRALGLLIAKCKAHGGVPHSVFSQLYDSLVQSIVDYGASVWGMNAFTHIKTVQFRAGRYFLGLGRYTPNNAVLGEMGWTDPGERLWKCVFWQWFRLAALPAERLNARVHSWALRLALRGTKNAYFKVIKFAQGMQAWDRVGRVMAGRSVVSRKLHDFFVNIWKEEINRKNSARGVGGNKLRTYRLLKTDFGTAHYVTDPHLTKAQRSALARFRCGVAPIRLETGRFEGLPVEMRLCPLCGLETETETHVIIKCNIYDDLRTHLFDAASGVFTDFNNLSDVDKVVFILTNPKLTKFAAKTCFAILKKRREQLYLM